MKKSLKSLNGEKLTEKDMISLKGGVSTLLPTLNMTAHRGQPHPSDDGTTDDSSWASA